MVKVLLKDITQVYQVGDKQLRGGELHDFTPAEIKKHSDIILAEIKEEKKKPKKDEAYFKAWNKAKQVKELEKLGIEPGKYEADRIKQLMEAQ